MGLTWLLYTSGQVVCFGGEVLVQSTPGFVLGLRIRGLTPGRFSHTSIGLKGPLVGQSPAISPNAARRPLYAYA